MNTNAHKPKVVQVNIHLVLKSPHGISIKLVPIGDQYYEGWCRFVFWFALPILEIRDEEKKSLPQKVTHSFYLKDYTGDAMKLRVK